MTSDVLYSILVIHKTLFYTVIFIMTFFLKEYMLQVNPANRPDIKEVLTGLEAIAIAMDVDLKGKVVSF